ncbi:MAG: hypothetical protein WEB63_03815 [Cucumibacter sp.]
MTEGPANLRLEDYLSVHAAPELSRAIAAIGRVAVWLAAWIARGPLQASAETPLARNASGDSQKAIDIAADRAFAEALAKAGLR